MSCMSDLSQIALWHILAFLLLTQIIQILSVETAFLLMPPKSRRRKVSKMAINDLKVKSLFLNKIVIVAQRYVV